MENVKIDRAPHKEVCRFAAAAFAILTAGFIVREYKMGHIWVKVYNGEEYINSRRQGSNLEDA